MDYQDLRPEEMDDFTSAVEALVATGEYDEEQAAKFTFRELVKRREREELSANRREIEAER
jgi:transcription termination factor Rho